MLFQQPLSYCFVCLSFLRTETEHLKAAEEFWVTVVGCWKNSRSEDVVWRLNHYGDHSFLHFTSGDNQCQDQMSLLLISDTSAPLRQYENDILARTTENCVNGGE